MMQALPRPTSGVLDGKSHWFPVRVYYEETDAGRMVYHAAYLKFAERARTELMRMTGLDHTRLMEEDGMVFTVHKADIRYLRQAKLDDELVVKTKVRAVGGASMHMGQSVHRLESGALADTVAELDLRLALVNEAGKPQRVPGSLRAVLEELRDEEG